MDYTRLQGIKPFEGMTEAQLKMLAGVMDSSSAAVGQEIVKQGDFGYEFMVIEEGTVDVLKDGAKIDEMGPGDFFGELAVLASGGQRNATIVATSPVKLLTLTSHYMRVIRDRMPSLGEQIDAVVAPRTH